MVSVMLRVFVLVGLLSVAGCASSGDGDGSGSFGGGGLTGDENGGKIPQGVGGATQQSSAYALVTAHCAKFGKKGFITKMDFDTGTMTFECRSQKPKARA
jgi:hypothetical protein